MPSWIVIVQAIEAVTPEVLALVKEIMALFTPPTPTPAPASARADIAPVKYQITIGKNAAGAPTVEMALAA